MEPTDPQTAQATDTGHVLDPSSAFWMHHTPMNVDFMTEILGEVITDINPAVLNTALRNSGANEVVDTDDPNSTVPAGGNNAATGCGTPSQDEAAVANSAMQFVNSCPTSLTVIFRECGMGGWVQFCNRLVLCYTSRIGTESLRAFRQRRLDDIVAFIVSEYESMVREGTHLEDRVIMIRNSSVRTSINSRAFLRELAVMFSEDVPRVVYAAWLGAAKNIVSIICPFNVPDRSLALACLLCSQVTHYGIQTSQFFHDVPKNPGAMVAPFNGVYARRAMGLALRNVAPLVETSHPPLPNTFFGIYDCVRGDDGMLKFRLLETSSTHTTNVVVSMILLVLQTCNIRNRGLPSLSERKLAELKSIYETNRMGLHDVIACSQDNIPRALQELARHDLLNILPDGPFMA